MQMVGATKRFIRRPFIWTNIKLGMLGAVIALGGKPELGKDFDLDDLLGNLCRVMVEDYEDNETRYQPETDIHNRCRHAGVQR